MKKFIVACAALMLVSFILPLKKHNLIKTSIYQFKVEGLSGGMIDFSQFKGKKILIVVLPSSRTTEDSIYLTRIDSIAQANTSQLI